MAELPYTNRELDTHFDEIKETLDRIEVQTTTTNGKVADIQGWRMWMNGGMAVLSAIMIPILFMLFAQYLSNRQQTISKDDIKQIVSDLIHDKTK